jgi:NADH-quinone oxidoreductase subunit M
MRPVFLAMVMTAIGLPLLAVFISEFLALRGAFEANPVWAAWAALGIILNAGYFLWLYQRMFFGTIDNPKNEKLTDLNGREWAVHDAATDSLALDRRLSQAVHRFH